ncbi:MAG: DedA family protein [Methylovulum sp.]|uniref:DedA family protein n=1 Tax=Methylovulum sp. TaxID=1916980 RepID=UPI002629FEDC|nr:DedA family protein [Methylovulum sp.]MDD2723515.1 DedA family protein [Methylovulum sp.]MDD5125786.1 DedA family protein [Methylovulum sp.]
MQDLLNFALTFSGIMPYVLVFVILLACGLGLPIPEDITLFVGGMLAYYGIVNVWAMVVVCMTGVLIGDSTIFLLGAKYGREITQKPFFSKILTPERLDGIKEKLHRNGNKVIFVSRFMPGLRAPTFFCAGTLHLPFDVFLFYDGLAALISVPGIVWVVYHFGHLADEVFTAISDVEHLIVFAIVAGIAFMIGKWYYHHKKSSQS